MRNQGRRIHEHAQQVMCFTADAVLMSSVLTSLADLLKVFSKARRTSAVMRDLLAKAKLAAAAMAFK